MGLHGTFLECCRSSQRLAELVHTYHKSGQGTIGFPISVGTAQVMALRMPHFNQSFKGNHRQAEGPYKIFGPLPRQRIMTVCVEGWFEWNAFVGDCLFLLFGWPGLKIRVPG